MAPQAVYSIVIGTVALCGTAPSADLPLKEPGPETRKGGMSAMHNPSARLTIANKGTSNPVILYGGKPMFRAGSVGEVTLFAFPWNSSFEVVKGHTHEQWAEWQKRNGMGYVRAYPESGYVWAEVGPESEKSYPWTVVRWEEDHPVVDLTKCRR